MVMVTKEIKPQEVLEDKAFKMFVKKKPITDSTIKSYMSCVTNYCNANQKTLTEIYTEQVKEQVDRVLPTGEIIKYKPEFSKIDDYQYELLNYLKQKGNKPSTINRNLTNIHAVLTRLGLQTPTLAQVPQDDDPWFVLTKSEITYVTTLCDFTYCSIIGMQTSGGFRIGDCLLKKVGDVIDGSYDQHGYTSAADFLAYAPNGMICKFDFIPEKTKRFGIQCIGYISPWTMDNILNMLREREKYFEKYNAKHGTDYHVEREDPLFASRLYKFKEPLSYMAVSHLFTRRHKELIKERTRILKQKLKNDEITKEEYKKLIQESPEFKTQHLRKFFINTLAENRVDLRASLLMEGHAPIVPTDPRYVSNSSKGIEEMIKEEYLKIVDNFNYNEGTINFATKKRNEELESRIKELESEKEDIIERSKVENKKMVLSILRDYGLEVK